MNVFTALVSRFARLRSGALEYDRRENKTQSTRRSLKPGRSMFPQRNRLGSGCIPHQRLDTFVFQLVGCTKRIDPLQLQRNRSGPTDSRQSTNLESWATVFRVRKITRIYRLVQPLTLVPRFEIVFKYVM